MKQPKNIKEAIRERYNVTTIKNSERDNLVVSWDFDEDENNKSTRFPVLLYTPDMKNMIEHHHIPLTRQEAETLWAWLTNYLERVCPK